MEKQKDNREKKEAICTSKPGCPTGRKPQSQGKPDDRLANLVAVSPYGPQPLILVKDLV
jgi:hypothetical protein